MSIVAGLYQMLCAQMHMGRGGATWVGVALSTRIASELSTSWRVATKEAEQARQTTQRPNKQLPQGPASNTAMEDKTRGSLGEEHMAEEVGSNPMASTAVNEQTHQKIIGLRW